MRQKLCVVTGTRADYFLLRPLIRLIQADPDFELQLVATGSHLEEHFGYTYQDLLDDGFEADLLLDLHLTDDSAQGVTFATSRAMAGFGEGLSSLNPDLVVILGDRYEMLGVAAAALFHRLPIAHLYGGDVTLGAFDEAIRHSISKMSHLHFVTNEGSAGRLSKMGEDPRFIFNVGSPNLDVIDGLDWMDREQLERELGIRFGRKNLLITFHPETLAADSIGGFTELLHALRELPADYALNFTKANADPQGQAINSLTEEFVRGRPNAKVFASLGARRYLSLMKLSDAVVGNSSSGIYEAPALQVPTVNIGRRQYGRIFAESVICCQASLPELQIAIERSLQLDCSKVRSPYGLPGASRRIMDILRTVSKSVGFRGLIQKGFYEEQK